MLSAQTAEVLARSVAPTCSSTYLQTSLHTVWGWGVGSVQRGVRGGVSQPEKHLSRRRRCDQTNQRWLENMISPREECESWGTLQGCCTLFRCAACRKKAWWDQQCRLRGWFNGACSRHVELRPLMSHFRVVKTSKEEKKSNELTLKESEIISNNYRIFWHVLQKKKKKSTVSPWALHSMTCGARGRCCCCLVLVSSVRPRQRRPWGSNQTIDERACWERWDPPSALLKKPCRSLQGSNQSLQAGKILQHDIPSLDSR